MRPDLLLLFVLFASCSAAGLFGEDEQEQEVRQIDCRDQPEIDHLDDRCSLIKLYDQALVDQMERDEMLETARYCAGQLCQMRALWERSFDDDPSTKRLAVIVQRLVNKGNGTTKHPEYLWSDIDFSLYGVSIWTATRDYFDKQRNDKSMNLEAGLRRELENNYMWVMVKRTCRKVSRDPYKLYRYLENLNRLDSRTFFQLTSLNQAIDIVYQASKTCKLLVRYKFDKYKLKPDLNSLYAPDPSARYPMESENAIDYNDYGLSMRSASAAFRHCEHAKVSFEVLALECPMMLTEKVSTDWLIANPNPRDRSRKAIQCACQLLMHNSTWTPMLKDPNVQVMSQALINYMNFNPVPDFDTTPVWTLHGWFTDIMSKFTKSRKMAVKEIVRTLKRNEDPMTVINSETKDHAFALELLRRGCNLIMFNHRKGSKQELGELKLIKYLDNLQVISQDPMFVFHLTLQNTDLFKLHALSKMCEPVVR